MNALQDEIIRWAVWWKERSCREVTKNRGTCIDEIHLRFSGSKTSRDPYCAKFAWVVLDMASGELGIQNPLPKSAGARIMRDMAKERMRVDRIPGAGSVFYRYSTAPGASGHIGVVIGWDDTTLYTIEGNNGPLVGTYQYSLSQVENAKNGFAFMHVEDFGAGLSQDAGWFINLLLLGGIASGSWYYWKNLRTR